MKRERPGFSPRLMSRIKAQGKWCADQVAFMPDFAGDLSQEILLTYLEHPDWRTTVTQASVDAVRKLFGRPTIINKIEWAPLDEALEVTNTRDNPESYAMARDALESYLKVLDDSDRLLLILRHQHGFTQRELAGMLGLTESAISLRLTRAIQKVNQAATAETGRKLTDLPG